MTLCIFLPMYSVSWWDFPVKWAILIPGCFSPHSLYLLPKTSKQKNCAYFILFYNFIFSHLSESLNFSQCGEASSNYCLLFWVLQWPRFYSKKEGIFQENTLWGIFLFSFVSFFFFFLILREREINPLSMTFLFSSKAQMTEILLLYVF